MRKMPVESTLRYSFLCTDNTSDGGQHIPGDTVRTEPSHTGGVNNGTTSMEGNLVIFIKITNTFVL